MNNTMIPADNGLVKCPRCGAFYHHAASSCPRCENHPQQSIRTTTLTASARPPTIEQSPKKRFSARASAMLQFLPTHTWVSLDLAVPMVLGRGDQQQRGEDILDLTGFDALKLGVSRRHCQLQRQGQQLVLLDLDSANGTHVNGQRLTPHDPYTLAHGDRLTLGALRCNVFFNTG